MSIIDFLQKNVRHFSTELLQELVRDMSKNKKSNFSTRQQLTTIAGRDLIAREFLDNREIFYRGEFPSRDEGEKYWRGLYLFFDGYCELVFPQVKK